MSLELGVWRIDNGVNDVQFRPLDLEQRLEDILESRIDIASPNWMVIGRQVRTDFDKFIDLLAIDRDGNLVILELKRDKTYRDIVAQVLDYGSWAKDQDAQRISDIYQAYVSERRPADVVESLDQAFCRHFEVSEMPEELNESHTLVIVASSLDPSTERIVRYLRDYHDVSINAIFFRVFRDEQREYLSRAWLTDPTMEPPEEGRPPTEEKWNNEYYVSYNAGDGPGKRSWEDAVKFGFISGGGGPFYSKTLHLLEPGGRIWVNVPGKGYVGVGIVQDKVVIADEFTVADGRGRQVPITSMHDRLKNPTRSGTDDPENAEYFVRVNWLKTVSVDEAIKEKGFFGNQNTVARPRAAKWRSTIDRLKTRFGVKD